MTLYKEGIKINKTINSLEQSEILKYALENGMLDYEDIQNKIQMRKRQEYLTKHNHEIWQNEKDRRWYTYLDVDNDRGYELKSRKHKTDIEELVIQYWKDVENDPYITSVFEQWNAERLKFKEITPQTHNKYMNDFKRFFPKDCFLHKKKFRTIDEYDLEMFIKGTINEHSLTAKAYSNLRTIIRGMFKYGKKRGYTNLSITLFFGDLDLSAKIFKKRIVSKEREVFSEDEVKLMTEYLRNKNSIRDLGILLAFETGLRVGELSGLKKVDLGERQIHVQRTEITYKDPDNGKRVCEVRDFPKSDAGDRYLILPKSAANTIRCITLLSEPDSEFLFSENGNRIRANAFNRRLGRICDILGIEHKSMHKIRKTYGTTLIDSNVDESLVASQMGHADISTTKKYYYFGNKNNASNMKQIDKALPC